SSPGERPRPTPGTGTLWGRGATGSPADPKSETAGRKLITPFPRPAMTSADPQGKNPVPWPPQPQPWTQNLPPSLVGNAVALVQDTVISLDLANAFPKYGFRNPNGPQQADSGGFDAPKYKPNSGNLDPAFIPTPDTAPITL